MLKRLDRFVKPAGLISSAKTYSILKDAKHWYFIHTGPSANDVRTQGLVQKLAVMSLNNVYEKKILEGEKRIDTEKLEELLKLKNCFSISANDVLSIEVTSNIFQGVVLNIKSSNKKVKLICAAHSKEEVESFIK